MEKEREGLGIVINALDGVVKDCERVFLGNIIDDIHNKMVLDALVTMVIMLHETKRV